MGARVPPKAPRVFAMPIAEMRAVADISTRAKRLATYEKLFLRPELPWSTADGLRVLTGYFNDCLDANQPERASAQLEWVAAHGDVFPTVFGTAARVATRLGQHARATDFIDRLAVTSPTMAATLRGARPSAVTPATSDEVTELERQWAAGEIDDPKSAFEAAEGLLDALADDATADRSRVQALLASITRAMTR